ncbi:MAG: YveK family protein [Paraclostridium sp.]
MNEGINIKEYISMFKKRKWIIILIMLASIGAGVLLTYRSNKSYIPIYQSHTRIRINTAKNMPEQGFSPGVTSMNQNISNTYLSLAKSKSTLNEIKNTLGLEMSIEALSSKIDIVADESNAEFVNITVTDTNPAMATTIANAVPTAFNNELIKTINLDCIQVIDLAADSNVALPQPKSNKTLKLAIVGLVISMFVVLLLEFLNNKIVTPNDVEQYWDAPLLGVVPYDKKKHFRKSKKEKLKTT